ncbi:MAG: peptidoglycan/LPS O-acetylase OafA/YrhL [Flavobacteriales bacterium]|jgi:peptidoglycan/LPS O-acetylase OafA/YrhL
MYGLIFMQTEFLVIYLAESLKKANFPPKITTLQLLQNFLDKHQNRLVGLDILRSLAILIVVYEHGRHLFPYHTYDQYIAANPIKLDGVSIFFVLSGFLIGRILLRIIQTTDFTGKDLVNFWIRRWFRTIPNYLFVLLVVVVCHYLRWSDFGNFDIRYIFFSQNLYSAHPDFYPEAWSLSVEEWFYMLFPISCFALHKVLKSKSRAVLISAIVFIVVPLGLRIAKFESGIGLEEIDLEYRKIVLLRLDSLMFGILAAYAVFSNPDAWKKYRYHCLSAGIILLVLLNWNPGNWKHFYEPLFFNIESITILLFLPFLSTLQSTKIKVLDGVFIFISVISYSLYLLNMTPIQLNLLLWINELLGRADLPKSETFIGNYVAFWVLTIGCSYLLYRFFENPMTRLRDKYSSK